MYAITHTLTRRGIGRLLRWAKGTKPRKRKKAIEAWQVKWFGMWGRNFLPIEPYEPPPEPDPRDAEIADLLRRLRMVAV